MLYPTELQLHIDILSQASQVAASLSTIESLIYYMKINIAIEFLFPSTESNRFLSPNLTGGEYIFIYVQCTF